METIFAIIIWLFLIAAATFFVFLFATLIFCELFAPDHDRESRLLTGTKPRAIAWMQWGVTSAIFIMFASGTGLGGGDGLWSVIEKLGTSALVATLAHGFSGAVLEYLFKGHDGADRHPTNHH